MKILLDFTSRAAGGGVTFLNNFIPHLAHIESNNIYYLFLPTPLSYNLPSNFKIKVVQLRSPYELWKIHWYQFVVKQFIQHEKIDLFYGSTGISPLKLTCPSVLTLQNLWPFLSNEASLQSKALKYLRKKFINKSAKSAALIHFASLSALQEHVRLGLSIDRQKARVVHFGIGNKFFKENEVLSNDLKIILRQNKNYILFVGNIFRHKNIITLIKAYNIIKNKFKGDTPDLLIAGKIMEADYMNEINLWIEQYSIHENVIFLGDVNYDYLPSIYRSAQFFVFPSVLETFGFPMIEAMACKVPLICSNIPIAHELCRDASLYFNPHDERELAALMLKVIEDGFLQKSLVEKGRRIADTFTWNDMARKMVALFSEAYALGQTRG
jgi:glycosyltransferase involved in cell wall biosynthesis